MTPWPPIASVFRCEPVVDLLSFLERGADTAEILYKELLLPHNLSRMFGGSGDIMEFCRVAEEFDVLQMFDVAMLAYAVGLVRRNPDAAVGVNMSYSTLSGSADTVLSQLENCSEDMRRRLLIEIVEINHLSNRPTTQIVSRIKELGTKIVLDDFGTGLHAGRMPNFYMCRTIPDIIKLDGSVVSLRTYNIKNNQRIIEQAVKYSELYGCAVVAEKLETREQVEFAVRSGIQYGQGYLFRHQEPPKTPSEHRKIGNETRHND